MQAIFESFPITEPEYNELDSKFGQLCHYAAWQLKKKNSQNNYNDDQDDIVQELRISLLRAGSYYKRQTYIESSFKSLELDLKDKFTMSLIKELRNLWDNRTRHGANRQKFGPFQELILERLVRKYVTNDNRPDRKRPLQIDTKFTTYCKQIAWNSLKSMGKKITREKSFRSGMVSLSEFDYLGVG